MAGTPHLVTDDDLDEVQRWFPVVGPEPREKVDIPKRGDGLSAPEVARQLGLSRQRVDMIEKAALKKLAALLAQRGLDLHDLI